jgi:SAM-dependent methyltransferase
LGVQRLADLQTDDLQICIDSLLEVLLSARRSATSNPPTEIDEELLHGYLSAFWLRPETALLQYVEARILSTLFKAMNVEPLLDIGCGNGVHTSLLNGWRFAGDFDVFQELDLQAADIYSSPPRDATPPTITQRGREIAYGLDVKCAMIQRAKMLGTFQTLLTGDATALPIADAQIACIYSNVIRDFEGTLDAALGQCARVLRPGGHLILISPTETYRDKLFYWPRAQILRQRCLTPLCDKYVRLDRGRSVFCRQQVPVCAWQQRLERCGLKLVKSIPFASRALLEFWDTGLRPFSTQLIVWAEGLRQSGSFMEIKRQIMSAMVGLFGPLLSDVACENDAAFRILVAQAEKA